MTINDLLLSVNFIQLIPYSHFSVGKKNLLKQGSRIVYNECVREALGEEPIYGVYIWVNPVTRKVLYIGMSGKMQLYDKERLELTQGSYSIQKRLVSSRGSLHGKNDISTWMFLRDKVFVEENIDSLEIHVFSTNGLKYTPTYVESVLLQKYYEHTRLIPRYNKFF
ncbi:hypothetical protein PQY73_01500 [Schleiferiaceae bacterium]|nr:hypothetical protein [Schleiferiaceae bacterium]